MVQINYRGPFTTKSAFTNKNTHPLLLDLILIKKFGPNYLEWEPETLWTEIEKSFKTTIAEISKNKIQAARTCHITDRPYEAWDVFEKVALSFGGGIPRFDMVQKPTPHVCASSLEVMKYIKDTKISDEVYKYITAILMEDGICYGPGTLEPCNKFLLRFVPEELQTKVKSLVEKGSEPSFDGTKTEDVQVFKVRSIEDYTEYDSRKLLKQIDVVIKGVS